MKLISCDGCGVVLDGDKLSFPRDATDDDGYLDETKAEYCQETKHYHVYVKCPVCGERVWGDEARL